MKKLLAILVSLMLLSSFALAGETVFANDAFSFTLPEGWFEMGSDACYAAFDALDPAAQEMTGLNDEYIDAVRESGNVVFFAEDFSCDFSISAQADEGVTPENMLEQVSGLAEFFKTIGAETEVREETVGANTTCVLIYEMPEFPVTEMYFFLAGETLYCATFNGVDAAVTEAVLTSLVFN